MRGIVRQSSAVNSGRVGEVGQDRGMQVLLIEDDPDVRNVVAKMLRRAGHDAIQCENGLNGIAQLRAAHVDVVLTDLLMPVMGGIEFIKRARLLSPQLKIIAMSGGGWTGSTDHLQAARQLGACATLHKPFTSAELQSAIEQCFGAAV